MPSVSSAKAEYCVNAFVYNSLLTESSALLSYLLTCLSVKPSNSGAVLKSGLTSKSQKEHFTAAIPCLTANGAPHPGQGKAFISRNLFIRY